MSDAVKPLLLLSELVCDISVKNALQITQQEYEYQITKINTYEKEIQVEIFMQAVLLLSCQGVENYVSSYSRVMSYLENCLNEGLSSIEMNTGKDSLTMSLTHHLLSVVQSLKHFIDRRFITFSPDNAAIDKPIQKQKFKLNIAVSVIATLTSAFVRSGDNVSTREETEIMRFIIQLFSSKQTGEIAFKSFQNHYRTPERSAITKSIGILQSMIMWLKKQ